MKTLNFDPQSVQGQPRELVIPHTDYSVEVVAPASSAHLRRIAHARDGSNCYAYVTVPPAAAAGLSAGAIAGIVIGCAVGAAGLAVGAAFLGLHLKRKNEAENRNKVLMQLPLTSLKMASIFIQA